MMLVGSGHCAVFFVSPRLEDLLNVSILYPPAGAIGRSAPLRDSPHIRDPGWFASESLYR